MPSVGAARRRLPAALRESAALLQNRAATARFVTLLEGRSPPPGLGPAPWVEFGWSHAEVSALRTLSHGPLVLADGAREHRFYHAGTALSHRCPRR